MSSIIGLILSLILLSYLLGYHFQQKNPIVFTKISDIIGLLDPPRSSIADLLLARARPNTRLIHAFGTREMLRRHTRHFAAFPDVVRGVVAGSALRLRSPSHQPSIPFAIFIQVVTMRVVVGSGAPPPPSTLLDSLNAHLRCWIPEQYERPLDFVIPAYETMWRVVAVTVARAIDDRGARAAFSAYLETPSQAQFVRFENAQSQQPSVEAFMSEVLRLHPPSRSLARAEPSRLGVFQFPPWAPVTSHIADIGALHQDTGIWGSDAGVFDPMRFKLHESGLSFRQKQAFMPFSYGPLRCIAFKEAPRFAAIVSAAVLEIVSAPDASYRLVCGEKIGRREGWEGWMIL